MMVKRVLLGMALIFSFILIDQSVASAAKVTKNSFLTTKRVIKTYNSSKTIKVTIPKGTTVLVNGTKNDNGQKYVSLNLNRLRYQIRRPLITAQNSSRVSRWILAKGQNFSKTNKPVYLSYYSLTRSNKGHALLSYVANGDLWKGSTLPADYAQLTGTRFTITTDGYLDFFSSSPYKYTISPKPTSSTEIQKSYYRSSRQLYLYFKTKLKGLPVTKVSTKGNNRYRLSINRTTQTTSTAIPNEDDATRVTLNEIYQIGKTDYYMHTENARFLGED
ncbi:hypothetical protein GQR93_04835 [Lentilactobacillus hilgardii]|jgi:hypothetical protein|uniref:Surface layer protein A domain-containing protein n=2 Tax=Lentilactobacillus hilgardii TaxID=1588 RepID=A0A6P1E8P1_LENHI|nr:hypothetical protein [Lentilactobacillus hilgardii]EEI71483.1 hypothetical protein HMPREF0496_1259 [Lentilactobacillus hilgardii ATCC 27305]MCT3392091.1 hypothetical protein [Lentilactobacillus hilgardii]QHB51591.1 hypothetical protein GQR93_04835 [Lentilactobacillus hilgardii]RRG12341.1 MAG: hypothetical protein DUD35_01855 [Lactobacillus sp.]